MEDTRKFVATVDAHHTCTTINNTRNNGLVPHWPFNLTFTLPITTTVGDKARQTEYPRRFLAQKVLTAVKKDPKLSKKLMK